MDTIKILLGATIALLLGALAVSWQGLKTGVKETSRDEFARLEKQLTEVRAEQEKLNFEKQMNQLRHEPAATPSSNASEIEAMKTEMAAGKEAIQRLQEEKSARDKSLAQEEDGLLAQRKLESTDSELRRARMISQALLVGRVTQYLEDANLGQFATCEVLMPELVPVGTIVAIRRKTGIHGKLKISDVTAEGAIANPMPGFGPLKPEAGDELILPPRF